MLNLSNLVKQYDGVRAVDDVSFTVEKGDIYGFLGPNGAGKTTTLRMIMGIIQPDSGLIELNGDDINNLARENLGYLPEDRGLYQKQKLEETIIYFGILRGLEKSEAKKRSQIWFWEKSKIIKARRRRKFFKNNKNLARFLSDFLKIIKTYAKIRSPKILSPLPPAPMTVTDTSG